MLLLVSNGREKTIDSESTCLLHRGDTAFNERARFRIDKTAGWHSRHRIMSSGMEVRLCRHGRQWWCVSHRVGMAMTGVGGQVGMLRSIMR